MKNKNFGDELGQITFTQNNIFENYGNEFPFSRPSDFQQINPLIDLT